MNYKFSKLYLNRKASIKKIETFFIAGGKFRFMITLVVWVSLLGIVFGQTNPDKSEKTLLILHTNDIHEHLRPDYDGMGGLPYVSGYIRAMRSKRNDVIVLDAGDVVEKGDLIARKTEGKMVFKAMSRIGYDAWAPGNHDFDLLGIKTLQSFMKLDQMDMLCANLFKEENATIPSEIYEKNAMHIGVIGATKPGEEYSLNLEATARAMAHEAQRLKSQTDLIFAVAHLSSQDARVISKVAPDIDVFITGHSHEELHEAIRVEETETLIVQAGHYAEFVGSLELTVDMAAKKIKSYEYRLVEMNHRTIAPDLKMLEWIRKKEEKLVPKAGKIVGWSPCVIDKVEVGYLAAEALRTTTGADIAFNYNTGAKLPIGILDLNAVYRTGGERRSQLIEVELSGDNINKYLQHLKESNDWHLPQWSGFYGYVEDGIFKSDLKPKKSYRVVMPEWEWNDRFLKFVQQEVENAEEGQGLTFSNLITHHSKPLELSWVEAMVHLLTTWNQNQIEIPEGIQTIIERTGQNLKMNTADY